MVCSRVFDCVMHYYELKGRSTNTRQCCQKNYNQGFTLFPNLIIVRLTFLAYVDRSLILTSSLFWHIDYLLENDKFFFHFICICIYSILSWGATVAFVEKLRIYSSIVLCFTTNREYFDGRALNLLALHFQEGRRFT